MTVKQLKSKLVETLDRLNDFDENDEINAQVGGGDIILHAGGDKYIPFCEFGVDENDFYWI